MNEKDREEFEIRVKNLEDDVHSLHKWISIVVALLAVTQLIEGIVSFILK